MKRLGDEQPGLGQPVLVKGAHHSLEMRMRLELTEIIFKRYEHLKYLPKYIWVGFGISPMTTAFQSNDDDLWRELK